MPQQQKTPVDLIIDGLMGSEFSVSLLRGDYITRELLWDSMDWANNNKAPVLSLDFPSGINASDGKFCLYRYYAFGKKKEEYSHYGVCFF